MNSRGESDSNSMSTIIMLILVIVVVFVGFNFLRSSAREGNKIVDLLSEDNSCLNLGRNQEMAGKEFADIDSDLRPDYCDVCVCSNEGCHNDNDADLDKVPDYCDLNKDDAKIGMCSEDASCDGVKCCKKEGTCGSGGSVKAYVDSFRCVIS